MPRRAPTRASSRAHRFRVRVYYEDTDAAGVVYYANYLRFAERARTEMLRALGRGVSPHGVVYVVRHCAADYLKPARLDDLLDVETSVGAIGGASLVLDQRVRRGATDIARLVVRLVALDAAGRPARLSPKLKAALARIGPAAPAT